MPTFVPRSGTGLVKPRSTSRDVRPQNGGLAVHWAGEGLHLANHAQCLTRWKQWQAMHMSKPRNWVDIAYNWGVCQHGYILTGRGYGIRSAANGSDDGNNRFLAACWLGGQGETPTVQAFAAFEALIADIRGRGAGLGVRPHSDFYATECPGPALTAFARSLNNRRMAAGSTRTPAGAPGFPLKRNEFFGPGGIVRSTTLAPWQRQRKIGADGIYGPKTRASALALQRSAGLDRDGLIGPQTWAAAWRAK